MRAAEAAFKLHHQQLRSEHADNLATLGLLDALDEWGSAILPP